MSRPEPGRARPTEPRSLVADADHWVSAPLVRQAIGAWAYAAASPERRPSEAAVRDAVGVAGALHELSRATADARWGGAVRPDLAALGDRAGLDEPAVRLALDLLERSGALARAGHDAVALADGLRAPHPGVARLAWDEARARLRTVAGSVAPALAVLRELAAAVGALADGEAPPPVRLSVRDLEERTGYGRSTVAEALGMLERARVVDVEARAGRTTRFTLRPAAFGAADEPPRAPTTDAAVAMPALRSAPAATPAPPPTGATPAPTGAPVLLGHFAGTPIYGPPGTPLVVTCDAAGRWSCRVGPFLTLGPIAAD